VEWIFTGKHFSFMLQRNLNQEACFEILGMCFKKKVLKSLEVYKEDLKCSLKLEP